MKRLHSFEIEFYSSKDDVTQMPNIRHMKAYSKPDAEIRFRKEMKKEFPREKFKINHISKRRR
jgi:hypothetical protein